LASQLLVKHLFSPQAQIMASLSSTRIVPDKYQLGLHKTSFFSLSFLTGTFRAWFWKESG